MTLDKLERDLYWAYERSSTPVMSRSSDVVSPKGSGGDLYELVLASATLQNLVENLSEPNRWVTKAKYSRDSGALVQVLEAVSSRFDLPEVAAQMFIARWLNLPLEQELQTLTGILMCSKSTISKKCTKVCTWLDKTNTDSLYELRFKILDSKCGN